MTTLRSARRTTAGLSHVALLAALAGCTSAAGEPPQSDEHPSDGDASGQARGPSAAGASAPRTPARGGSTPPPVPPGNPDPDFLVGHPSMPSFSSCTAGDGALGGAGGRLYWWRECSDRVTAARTWVLASAPANGAAAATVLHTKETYVALFAVDAHVVFQTQRITGGAYPNLTWAADDLFVVAAGTTTPVALTGSTTPCAAVTSDATRVLCVTTEAPQRLLAWTVGETAGPTTLLQNLGDDVTGIQVDGEDLYVAHEGHHCVNWKALRTCDGTGSIAKVSLNDGASSVVYANVAPSRLVVRGSGVAWHTGGTTPNMVSNVSHGTTAGAAPETVAHGEWSSSHLPFALAPSSPTAVLHPVLADSWPNPTRWDIERASLGGSRAVVAKPNPSYPIDAVAVDATHVYWATDAGIFRHAQ